MIGRLAEPGSDDMSDARTTVRHDDGAGFDAGLRRFFAYRDLGVADVSGGGFGAHVIRPVLGAHPEPQWHTHALQFQMVYVLRGWVEFEYADVGAVRLEMGSSVYQPPGLAHREVAHSDDLEILEVTCPAVFETTVVPAPDTKAGRVVAAGVSEALSTAASAGVA